MNKIEQSSLPTSEKASQSVPRFGRRLLLTFVLIGMSAVAVVAYSFFGVGIQHGHLLIVTAVAAIGLFLAAQFVRYRQRLSLRTIMIIVSVLGVGLAFVGRHLAQVRIETAAVEKIIDRGGSVSYGPWDPDAANDFIESPDDWHAPAWAEKWLGKGFFLQIRGIAFSQETADADLALLSDVREVAALDLARPNITSAGLAQMRLPPDVKQITLNWQQLTEESAAHLAEMPELQCLIIAHGAGPRYGSGNGLVNGLTRHRYRRANGVWGQLGWEVLSTDMRLLRHFRQVSDLELEVTELKVADARTLAELPRLQSLTLNWCLGAFPDDVRAVAELARSNSIRELKLGLPRFSNNELLALTAIPSLELVEIRNSDGLNFSGVSAFRAVRDDVDLILVDPRPGVAEPLEPPQLYPWDLERWNK